MLFLLSLIISCFSLLKLSVSLFFCSFKLSMFLFLELSSLSYLIIFSFNDSM